MPRGGAWTAPASSLDFAKTFLLPTLATISFPIPIVETIPSGNNTSKIVTTRLVAPQSTTIANGTIGASPTISGHLRLSRRDATHHSPTQMKAERTMDSK